MYKCYFKRILDFLIVLSVLSIIWPVLLVVAVWLHFANKGVGAFFCQQRPGKNGRIFKLMDSIFVQIFMANVVIIMKLVASVQNCCTETKHAGSKEF